MRLRGLLLPPLAEYRSNTIVVVSIDSAEVGVDVYYV